MSGRICSIIISNTRSESCSRRTTSIPIRFLSDNRQYLNQMYTTSLTIPVPLREFGAVAALFPTNFGLYAKAGVYTVYSDDVGFTADSFFNRPQYFRHLEPGLERVGRDRNADPGSRTDGRQQCVDHLVEQGRQFRHGRGEIARDRIQRQLPVSPRHDGLSPWRLVRRVATGPKPQRRVGMAAIRAVF